MVSLKLLQLGYNWMDSCDGNIYFMRHFPSPPQVNSFVICSPLSLSLVPEWPACLWDNLCSHHHSVNTCAYLFNASTNSFLFYFTHVSVTADTCVAMNQWVQNPKAHTALDDILPCVDNVTAQETLLKSKEVTSQLVSVVNQVITNVSNINFSPNFAPFYFNQSGPLVPVLCDPFNSDMTDRVCSAGEVDLDNATQVFKILTYLITCYAF